MKKYYIDYVDKSEDVCHVWVGAEDKQHAEAQVRSEYWNIDQIISIHL